MDENDEITEEYEEEELKDLYIPPDDINPSHYEEEEEEAEEEGLDFYEISAHLTIRLKQTFEHFDKEKHEFLPTKQLGTLMRFVGFTPFESDIKYAIECLHLDPRGTINFQQFFQVVQMIARDPEPEEDILEAFQVLDEEQRGWFPSMELKEILTKQGEKLKEEDWVELVKIADKKKSGKIKYENLIVQLRKMLNKMPPILECDKPPPPDPKELLRQKREAKLAAIAAKKRS